MSKQIHFSIDDVFKSFQWITNNQPNSIFDTRFFGTLRKWHESFDMKVSLYCYWMLHDQTLDRVIPTKYKDELIESSDWIRFGFHGVADVPFTELSEYKECFYSFSNFMKSLGLKPTQILRLDYWYATNEQKRFLFDNKIRTLLYPDNDKLAYDDDSYFDAGMNHWKTNIRYENILSQNEIIRQIGKPRIVAFTHEYCFEEEMNKIEQSFCLFKQNEYIFI